MKQNFAVNVSRYGETFASGYDIMNSFYNIYRYSCVHAECDQINVSY
ncbi:MAG: hypothetical protein OXC63_06770 [Aestuariivita sp.]|nr:hypothetical protein [Aestuariivita sp.]